jgi:hypothetical protein
MKVTAEWIRVFVLLNDVDVSMHTEILSILVDTIKQNTYSRSINVGGATNRNRRRVDHRST